MGRKCAAGRRTVRWIISDEEIGSPLVRHPSAVIAMNLPSLDKYENEIMSGGVLVVNSSIVNRSVTRPDVKAVSIPGNEIAKVASVINA